MTHPQRYAPAPGKRVVLPSGGDWPVDGLPVDFSNPYQSRLVRDGDLMPVTEKKKRRPRAPASGGESETENPDNTDGGDA